MILSSSRCLENVIWEHDAPHYAFALAAAAFRQFSSAFFPPTAGCGRYHCAAGDTLWARCPC